MRTLVLAGCLLAGCSESPQAPVIDYIQMPDTATLGASGSYALQGQLAFHDDDNPVTGLRIHVPLVNQSTPFPVDPPIYRGSATIVVQFAPASPRGVPIEYSVILTDATALDSAPAHATVTLQ